MGYSRDLCSYARSDIACSTVNGGPIGGLPDPDMLVCCNNICGTVLKWYEVQARYYKVPLFIFDTPFCHTEFSDEARTYVSQQIHEYLAFLEQACGKKFDHDRMKEVGRLSLEGQRLWQEVLDTAMHKPAPMIGVRRVLPPRAHRHPAGHADGGGLLPRAPRRDEGSGGAEDRRRSPTRNTASCGTTCPVWYKTKWLSEKFAAHGACLVADTYTSAWCGQLDYLNDERFPRVHGRGLHAHIPEYRR